MLRLVLHLTLCFLLTTAQPEKFRQPFEQDLIYTPNAVQRYVHTEPGSYFGYSVAGYVGQSQPFALVGAPRASKEPSLGLDSRFAYPHSRTGLVYRIELDTKLPYCSVVPVATTDEMRREHGTPTPGITSWLGGSVAAASNSVNGIQLACDPRYIYAPDPINQTESDVEYPSEFAYGTRTYVGTGHCALYTGASMRYTSVDSCNSQVEGACLAGFSADVEAGMQFGEAYVALGMPGSYLTEGNVFLGHYRGREVVSAIRLKNSPQDLKHMGFNLGFAVNVAKLIRNSTSSNEHSRQSDMNTIAKSSGQWSVLASSSMWLDNDYRGIVMILDKSLDLGGVTYLKDHWGHIGSFFGYSLATADLDGNGLVDVIVGAPYYTEQKHKVLFSQFDQESIKPSSSTRVRASENGKWSETEQSGADKTWGRLLPDIGRVYVFYGYRPNNSNARMLASEQTQPDYLSHEPVILSGFNSVSGRFGHAVANLGDVDGDGTDDLAVSCPYCADPEGRKDKGAVFIYLGQKDVSLEDKPFQVIWPGDLSRSASLTNCGELTADDKLDARVFKSFGWSLSGGTDLDGNKAPDLIIGDFDSDQVVLLRARNTLWFDSPEWDIPVARTLVWSRPGYSSCGVDCQFAVHLSVVVHGNEVYLRRQTGQLKLRVTIDLDAAMDSFAFKRLTGRSTQDSPASNQTTLGVLETVVPLITSNSEQRNRINLVSVVLEPQPNQVRLLLWKPVLINVSIAPVLDAMPDLAVLEPVSSWALHPFLGQRSFISRAMYFANPACGPDHICHADLQVRMVDLSEGPTDNLVVYFRERITQRNLTVGIGNTGENAYAAQLRITFPHRFSFTVPSGLVCRSEVLMEHQATQLLCDVGDPLGYTGSNFRPYVFQLNTGGAFRELDETMNDEPDLDNTGDFVQSSESMWDAAMDSSGSTPEKRPRRTVSDIDTVTIVAEVLSGNEEADPRDNIATISYKLQLAAKIELSSSSIDRTTIDSRNFTIQLYEMQRVYPETLGPEIKHVYLVSNDGPSPMANLWVNVTMPIQTHEGEHLVYFLDHVRYQAEDGGPPLMANMAPEVVSAEGHVRGTCTLPEWAANPLRLNAIHRGQLYGLNEQTLTSNNADRLIRGARSFIVEQAVSPFGDRPDTYTKPLSRNARSVSLGGRKRQQEIIQCEQELADLGVPICVTINCQIDQLSRGDAVRIVVRGYVWADTYFRHKISDLAIVSEAKSKLPVTAFGIPVSGNRTVQPLTISQNFVFNGITVHLLQEIPVWPIILGCILGAVLLALIIFAMWRCGFFRRKRWYTSPQPNSLVIAPAEL